MMANANPKTKANTPTLIDIDKLKYLYFEMKMSQEEVATAMAVSRKVIYNAMKRNGLQARKAVKRNQKGANNDSWKGGKVIHKGYIMLRNPEHPKASSNGYVYEHVLLLEKHLGRTLNWYGPGNSLNEVVHHKNEDKTDNRIENLELMTHSEHVRLHNKLRRAKNENTEK